MRAAVYALLLLMCSTAAAAPPIKIPSSGLLVQRFVHQLFMYVVDTNAHLCMVVPRHGGTVTPIDCNHLKHRRDWAPLISWSGY
jgi:hypothetical protein